MSTAREPIFDDFERTDPTPSQHIESTYEFLNRVAGDYWSHPRQLMQDWLERLVGDEDYKDLRQRFRSRDDEQFRSAFLELYLHESLLRAGYSVTIHPTVADSSHRPDFRAERGGEVLYVEAVAPGASREAKAKAQRRAVLFDSVNRLGDPNFMLWLERLEEGGRPPAAARLRKDLRQWLSNLNPDTIADLESAPTHTWRHDGWSVTFRAIPKRPEARGVRPNDRAIGVYGHGEASLIDDAPGIVKALVAKHHVYGDLGAPFVIAVGTYIFDTDRWHSSNALLGRTGVQFLETPTGEVHAREVREPNGYFGIPPRWGHTNVSGVLLVNQLMPYHVHKSQVTLWRHPGADHPLPEGLGLPGESVTVLGNQLSVAPPETEALSFFDLPDPWPPGEPWPSKGSDAEARQEMATDPGS